MRKALPILRRHLRVWYDSPLVRNCDVGGKRDYGILTVLSRYNSRTRAYSSWEWTRTEVNNYENVLFFIVIIPFTFTVIGIDRSPWRKCFRHLSLISMLHDSCFS